MNAVMSESRVRLVLQIPEELRAALRLEAARRGEDMQDIVAAWIEENCADSLAEVRLRAAGQQAKPSPKKGKGKGTSKDAGEEG